MNIDDLLLKHDYMVKVVASYDDTIDATHNYVLLNVNYAGKLDAQYCIFKNGFITYTYGDASVKFENFPLNVELLRLYTLCDIYRQCRELDLSYEIVRFISSTGDFVKFTDLIPLELTEQEALDESRLNHLAQKLFKHPESINKLIAQASKEGILHKFLILKGLIV